MAGKASVGSLYYQVVLDPSGFTRGATKIRSEQASLKKSIQKFDTWNKSKKDTYKEEMLERIKVMRKLLDNGKMTSEKFKALYKGEAAAYRQHQNDIIHAAKQKQNALDRLASIERRRRVQRYKQHQEAVRDGQMGFSPMVSAHIGDMKKGFTKGGFQGLNQMANSMQMMFMKFWQFLVGWQILKGVVGSIVMSFTSLIKRADERRRQTTIMASLFGSEREAKRVQKALIDYAKRTSFGVKQTMELTNQLVALGFAADEAVDGIKLFGNLSFGDPMRLRLIAKAFSDVRAQGKLMMTEIRQFANSGVPLLDQLSLNLGVNGLEIRQMVTEGKITADLVQQALQDISEAYGDTAGAAMGTSTGQWERMVESAGELAVKVGGPLSTAFRIGIIEPLANVLDRLDEMMPEGGGASDTPLGKGMGYGVQAGMGIYGMPGMMMNMWNDALNSFQVSTKEMPGTSVGIEPAGELMNALHLVTFGMMGMSDEALHSIYLAKAQNKQYEQNIKDEQAHNKWKLQEEREYRSRLEAMFPWAASSEYNDRMTSMLNEQEEVGKSSAEIARMRYVRELDALRLQDKINDLMYDNLLSEYDRTAKMKGKKTEGKGGSSLPSDAFRKNSIAEFRYLQGNRTLVDATVAAATATSSNTEALNRNTDAVNDNGVIGGSGNDMELV